MELELGTNKKVILTPWKSKTKKDFIKIFKLKEDKVSEEDILQVLVIPYIEPNNVYYSPDEVQYILGKLREISIDDDLIFSIDCDNEECGKEIDVSTSISDIMNYDQSKFPIEINEVVWRDLTKPESIKNITKKYPEEPPRELAMLLHIEKFKNETITNFDSIMDIVDNLSLKEAKNLEKDYVEASSNLNINLDIVCPHCEFSKNYLFDIIPTFFDPLLPKQS